MTYGDLGMKSGEYFYNKEMILSEKKTSESSMLAEGLLLLIVYIIQMSDIWLFYSEFL